MEKVKQLGIWMDHSNAILMELTNDTIVESNIASGFTKEVKEIIFEKGENFMHNKEKHLHLSYYKKLGEIIRNYQEVLLFGPTSAKNELSNLLKTDHLFADIKIEVKNSDKMSANEMHAFVKQYFIS